MHDELMFPFRDKAILCQHNILVQPEQEQNNPQIGGNAGVGYELVKQAIPEGLRFGLDRWCALERSLRERGYCDVDTKNLEVAQASGKMTVLGRMTAPFVAERAPPP